MNIVVIHQLRLFSSTESISGDTAVTVTINGPGEVKLHNLQIDKAHVEVYYRSKSGLPSIDDKLREKIIRDTCESAILSVLYPRSSIILQIHELENAGGVSCSAFSLHSFQKIKFNLDFDGITFS